LVDCKAFNVGKFVEVVLPVTYAKPALVTAMAQAASPSTPAPPRYVE
jgi:hypothetical protein